MPCRSCGGSRRPISRRWDPAADKASGLSDWLLGDQGGRGGGQEAQTGKKSQTPALDTFGRDLTQLAREDKLDPVIGREGEIERLILDQMLPLAERGLDVVAVSGIAVPKGFEDELVRQGANVMQHITYADHHRYTDQEILNLINTGLERKAQAILTTEKDSVRLPSDARLMVRTVAVELAWEDEDAIDALLFELLAET